MFTQCTLASLRSREGFQSHDHLHTKADQSILTLLPCPSSYSIYYPYNYTYIQEEASFREELESVNITVASRMFRTEDDPIKTADLFVSV